MTYRGMPFSVNTVIIIAIFLPAIALSQSISDNICQSTNCQNSPGTCSEGYFCILTDSSIPDGTRCSMEKVNLYIDQKIKENRFVIEPDSSHMERYRTSVMDAELSKGCLLNELEPLVTKSEHTLILTTEFINYQKDKSLPVKINWYLKPESTGMLYNVTEYCPKSILLEPLEHRMVSCIITDSFVLTDTSYIYYSTGTYETKEGGNETIYSEYHRAELPKNLF